MKKILILPAALLLFVACSGSTSTNIPPLEKVVTTPDYDSGSYVFSDSGVVDGGEKDSCVPQTDNELCSSEDTGCGYLVVVDVCGTTRTVNCGTCGVGLSCNNGNCSSPACTQEADSVLCATIGKNCGSPPNSVIDNCGNVRSLNCGNCAAPLECSTVVPTVNTCCLPESDAAYCLRTASTCANTAPDNCGTPRTVNCGTLAGLCQPGYTCTSGKCGCIPQTDTELCASLKKDCGTLSVAVMDNCLGLRNPSCGPIDCADKLDSCVSNKCTVVDAGK